MNKFKSIEIEVSGKNAGQIWGREYADYSDLLVVAGREPEQLIGYTFDDLYMYLDYECDLFADPESGNVPNLTCADEDTKDSWREAFISGAREIWRNSQ